MHYYQFNIGNYRRDTTHLTMVEHGAYRQLIDQYYLKEEPIPLNLDKVMRTHCARNADESEAIKYILSEYFEKTENGYIHHGCNELIDKYSKKSAMAKKSAEARWNKAGQTKANNNNANALRTDSEGNANHKPLTTNQEPIKKKVTKKFKPPLLEDLLIYISANLYQVNAESFLNFYESKGWMVGRNNMKDWKAAVRQWHSRNKEKTNEENRRPSTSKAKQHSDRLDEITRRDIEENGVPTDSTSVDSSII